MFTDENASPQVYAPWYQKEQLADENAETEQQSASRRILGRRDKPIQESIQCRVRRTQHDHPTTKHPPNLSIGRRRATPIHVVRTADTDDCWLCIWLRKYQHRAQIHWSVPAFSGGIADIGDLVPKIAGL